MEFEPFTKVEEVEKYFNNSIYKNGKEMTVVGASYAEKSKALYIQAVDEYGKELSMPAMNWFYSAKYMGHPFGKPMKGNENEEF